MANILFLVHRLPYPPNKGDKVRSFHLLKHLALHHNIFLGTFVDDPNDLQYVDTVRGYCSDLHIAKLNPRMAKLRSLNGLIAGDPLTLRYYRDATLYSWVEQICKHQRIDAAVIFCSAMAQYIDAMPRLPTLVDFVDVDSAKWTQYAPSHRWPLSWLYRREGEFLLNYERSIAARSTRSFFVTEAEAALFTRSAPECATRVESLCNGVNADFFSPDTSRVNPFDASEIPIVFTGAMDYLPNIDAVRWFAKEVLPELLLRHSKIRFYIVGRSPVPEVLVLGNEHIKVTGTVDDVRPYLQHAAVVVAPLRIARGIQNKILEAMAMARPIVASAECAAAVDAVVEQELLIADTSEDFIRKIENLLLNVNLGQGIGQAARQRVQARYSWEAHLRGLDKYLPSYGQANP